MQTTEQTTLPAGPATQKQVKPVPLHSYLWKSSMEKFVKGEPRVLGVVQIMIGLMNISVGAVMMSATLPFYGWHPMSVYAGYMIWGSVMFILSGSLSTAAGRRATRSLVQASLGLNITSAVVAAAGIIITALSLAFYFHFGYYCSHDRTLENCLTTKHILMGLDGVVLILSVLEFCIAVSLSAFGCKVTCCNPGGTVLLLPSNPHVAEPACAAPPE